MLFYDDEVVVMIVVLIVMGVRDIGEGGGDSERVVAVKAELLDDIVNILIFIKYFMKFYKLKIFFNK
jgi:hypothetical protein